MGVGGGKKKGKDAGAKAKAKEEKRLAQEKKAAKGAKKKAKKDGTVAEEEDIESILKKLEDETAAKAAATAEVVGPPPPRSNASLVAVPGGDIILFGGEFFDGDVNTCYNHLFRFSVDKNEWKQYTSPTCPNHRCSHQAAVVRDWMWVFGGEFATRDQFYHYNDLWRLSILDNHWERVDVRGKGPSARSGHRIVAWKHYLVLHGGFYEAFRGSAWYDDLWLFDTREMAWVQPKLPEALVKPAARSGSAFIQIPNKDILMLYGGYSEVSAAGGGGKRGKVHTDLWLLHMGPFMSGGVPKWERVRCVGAVPSTRTSFTMVPYKERVLLFGGVADTEDDRGEQLESKFFSDMYAWDFTRRRWYEMGLKDEKAKKAKRRKPKKKGGAVAHDEGDEAAAGGADSDFSSDDDGGDDEEDNEVDLQAIMDGLVDENAFYYWEDGKLVRMELSDDEDEGEGEGAARDGAAAGDTADAGAAAADGATALAEGDEAKGDEAAAEAAAGGDAAPAAADSAASAAADAIGETAAGEAVPGADAPAAAEATATDAAEVTVTLAEDGEAAAAGDDTGAAAGAGAGAAEAAEAEPQRVGPSPRIKSMCFVHASNYLYVYGGLVEGREREVTMDDMWRLNLVHRKEWEPLLEGTYKEREWKGDASDDEDSEDDDEEGAAGAGAGGGSDDEEEDVDEETAKARRKALKAEQASLRDRIKTLRAAMDLGDAARTPVSGEALRDFFARTVASWVDVAASQLKEGERLRGKELRRKAFGFARERYYELAPVLEELNELEAEQQQLEREFGRGRSRAEVLEQRDRAREEAAADGGKKGKKKKKKDRS